MKKKRKLPRFEDLTPEEYQKLTSELKSELERLENRNEQMQNEISDLSARKAYLEEISEQNERLLKSKKLL